jgi:sterol desaturase/sphingolipid hydroxylase (fatty acid hydroxylase superfamily)
VWDVSAFWAFASEHWFVALLMFLIGCQAAISIFGGLINLLNRVIRHMNIRKHGWPPDYLDADGDFKRPEAKHNESNE